MRRVHDHKDISGDERHPNPQKMHSKGEGFSHMGTSASTGIGTAVDGVQKESGNRKHSMLQFLAGSGRTSMVAPLHERYSRKVSSRHNSSDPTLCSPFSFSLSWMIFTPSYFPINLPYNCVAFTLFRSLHTISYHIVYVCSMQRVFRRLRHLLRPRLLYPGVLDTQWTKPAVP